MTTTITIEVEREGDTGKVDAFIPDGTDFTLVMMAAEFLLHLVAQKSGAGYEKALELVVQGAMTYRKADGA